MDASQRAEDLKKLAQLTQYVYACFLIRELPQEVKVQYPTCSEVPHHISHACAEPTFNPYVLLLYVEALYRVKLCKVEDVCQRACKKLDLGSNGINPKKDIKLLIKRCFAKWFNSDFGSMEDDLTVQPDVAEAVAQAFEEHEHETRYRQFKAVDQWFSASMLRKNDCVSDKLVTE